jgi:hypothetical protein
MKTVKTVLSTLVVAALCFVLSPSATSFASGGGGGGGGGTVAGKCGVLTTISASSVQLKASGGTYTSTPLELKGTVFNCSTFSQWYWIDFDEPTNTNTACSASFSLFNALLMSSGSSQGWSTSINITPAGVSSPTGCVGTHTVRAVLRNRTDGSVMSTATVNYTVTLA